MAKRSGTSLQSLDTLITEQGEVLKFNCYEPLSDEVFRRIQNAIIKVGINDTSVVSGVLNRLNKIRNQINIKIGDQRTKVAEAGQNMLQEVFRGNIDALCPLVGEDPFRTKEEKEKLLAGKVSLESPHKFYTYLTQISPRVKTARQELTRTSLRVARSIRGLLEPEVKKFGDVYIEHMHDLDFLRKGSKEGLARGARYLACLAQDNLSVTDVHQVVEARLEAVTRWLVEAEILHFSPVRPQVASAPAIAHLRR